VEAVKTARRTQGSARIIDRRAYSAQRTASTREDERLTGLALRTLPDGTEVDSSARWVRSAPAVTRPWTSCLPVLAAACVRVAPPPPPVPTTTPPPPAVVVPAGCEVDLSGRYVHARDARFRYLATDTADGGALLLEVFFEEPVDAGRPPRRFSRDGGLPWLVRTDAGAAIPMPADAGPAPVTLLRLARTPAGFVGASAPLPDGGCAFPARLAACRADGLVLEAPPALGPDCAPLDGGWSAQVLHRLAAPFPDGGLDTAHHIGEDAGPAGDGGDVTAPPAG
jgi:hypothetical protein